MTREEAIKIVKENMHLSYDDGNTFEALKTLVPELCEYEDERIIKTLQEYVKNRNWPLNEPTQDEVLVWLEKQKDKMTAEEYENSELFQLKLKTKYANGYQDGLVQKEQKQWSEEDERMLSRCIKSVECSKQFADSESYKAAKDVEMNWLKSLPERFVLQAKQEWSEEDEDFINMLILHFNYLVNKGGDSVETYKSYIKGLKSLCSKPHTVSIKNANKFAELEYKRGVKDGIQSEKKRHWKPSEKQLIALRYYLNHVPYSTHKEHLSSLRDDCEKLFFQ